MLYFAFLQSVPTINDEERAVHVARFGRSQKTTAAATAVALSLSTRPVSDAMFYDR